MDYKDQIQTLKNRKALARLQEEDTDEKVIELLTELEKAKEKDLRAEMDKQEIKDALKDMDQNALTHADRQKKRELEKLSGERENLRIREQQLVDDIKDMEQEMVQREKKFRKEVDDANKRDDIFATDKIKKKELEMAKDRGEVVVKLQHKREKLERERDRIMKDLDKVTRGRMPDARPKSGLSNAGADIMGGNIDLDRAELDPAIKDKIIADQVKINYLREEQQRTNKLMMDMDELDHLENEVNYKVRNNHPTTSRMPNNRPLDYMPRKDPLKGFNQTLPPKASNSDDIGSDLQNLK